MQNFNSQLKGQLNYAAMFENKDVDPFYKEKNVIVYNCCLQESYRLFGDQQYCIGSYKKGLLMELFQGNLLYKK